jgi:hypothetical protein
MKQRARMRRKEARRKLKEERAKAFALTAPPVTTEDGSAAGAGGGGAGGAVVVTVDSPTASSSALSPVAASSRKRGSKPAKVYPGPQLPAAALLGKFGDFPATMAAAKKALAYFDVLRGRGDALWRDMGIEDVPRLVRMHQESYEMVGEACKRLAYDHWVAEVRGSRVARAVHRRC